jgi:hypothetical protein
MRLFEITSIAMGTSQPVQGRRFIGAIADFLTDRERPSEVFQRSLLLAHSGIDGADLVERKHFIATSPL